MYRLLRHIFQHILATFIVIHILTHNVTSIVIHNLTHNITHIMSYILTHISGARPASIFDKKRQNRTAYTKTDKSGYTKPFGAK
jgi:hypothetical protein